MKAASTWNALTSPASTLGAQVLRYLLVGGLAFLVDYATLLSLVDLAGWHYGVATAVGFAAGLLTNYLLSIKWVFNSRTLGSRRAEFIVFALIGALGLLLTELMMWTGVDLLSIDYRVAKLFAVATVLFWNFTARKLLLFRASPSQG